MYPTAVRQTVTLLYDTPLEPGLYRIDLFPLIQTASFNTGEIQSLTGGKNIFGGHSLVTPFGGQVFPGGVVTASVDPAGDSLDFSQWPGGTPFLSQLHDDLGTLLDLELTQNGANDSNIPNVINQQIADRIAPASGAKTKSAC